MNPSGIRKTISWGGAAGVLLLALVGIATNWWAFRFHPTSHTCVATGGVGVIIVAWIGPPLMTEAQWNTMPKLEDGASSRTYEEFVRASPFSGSYFKRNNRAFDYKPPFVWLWPWESKFGAGEQTKSRFVFKSEASTPALRSYPLANPYWRCSLLLWPFVLACAAITALAWWYHLLFFWRARAGFCRKCKYDRTGLRGGASAACPECGTVPKSVQYQPQEKNTPLG